MQWECCAAALSVSASVLAYPPCQLARADACGQQLAMLRLSNASSSSLYCAYVSVFCRSYRHLANYLQATCKEDVVLLQEVWVDADAQQLIAAGRAGGLVHATHFRCVLWHGTRLCAGCLAALAHHQWWLPVSCTQLYLSTGSTSSLLLRWQHYRNAAASGSGANGQPSCGSSQPCRW